MRSAAIVILIVLTACGHDPKPTAKSPSPSSSRRVGTTFIATPIVVPQTKTDPVSTSNVRVSGEIAALCNITATEDTAPKFDFDDATLTGYDRSLLDQIGRCMLSGPLAGRSILLTGRADPRGEEEYNMSLGARRAGSAREYLREIGVSPMRMTETSRGKLDANGTDEPSWAQDRRVDISLI